MKKNSIDVSAKHEENPSDSTEELVMETASVSVKIESADEMRAAPKKIETVSMTSYDNYYYRLTTPGNYFVICSFMWIEGDVTPETAVEITTELSMTDVKFRRRATRGSFWKYGKWVDMDTITETVVDEETGETKEVTRPWTAKDQLTIRELDTSSLEGLPEEEKEMREREMIENEIANFFYGSLDESRPLWRAILIRGLTGNRSMLGFGADHCLTDGQGFVRTVSSLMKPLDPNEKLPEPNFKMPSFSLGTRFLYFILGMWYTLTTIFHLVFYRRKSFQYKGPETSELDVAWTNPMSMDDVKVIRTAHPGATLNDVLVACLERSFTAYLDNIEKDTAEYPGRVHKRDKLVNIIIPKGLRAPDDTRFMNHASIEFMRLSVLKSPDITTSKAIYRAKKAMNHVKLSRYASFMKSVIDAFTCIAPGFYPLYFFQNATRQIHGVITNIPGPTKELYLGNGEKRHRCLGYVSYPPIFPVGCASMTITSYNNTVRFNALTRETTAYPKQAHTLVNGVQAAFDAMLADSRKILAEKANEKAE
ncbi:hypothetical protein BDF22DRAFT_662693 [Syncephalis plumigaleata]|nr:hypothetical protein BDF22DRAFT_662693 [Syncephalis plumigaleata]